MVAKFAFGWNFKGTEDVSFFSPANKIKVRRECLTRFQQRWHLWQWGQIVTINSLLNQWFRAEKSSLQLLRAPRSFLPNSRKSRMSRFSLSCRRTCYSDGQQVSSEFITCWGMSPTSFTHLSSQPPSSSFFLVDIKIISNLITDLTVLNQYKYKVDIRPVHKNLFWEFPKKPCSSVSTFDK